MSARLARAATALCALLLVLGGPGLATSRQGGAVPDPESFFGFRIGADNHLARWDRIVAYMEQVARTSDRVRVRRLVTRPTATRSSWWR